MFPDVSTFFDCSVITPYRLTSFNEPECSFTGDVLLEYMWRLGEVISCCVCPLLCTLSAHFCSTRLHLQCLISLCSEQNFKKTEGTFRSQSLWPNFTKSYKNSWAPPPLPQLWEPWNYMQVCVSVCVSVSWWLWHLSPCPPNETAPAGESLAYLAAVCPKLASWHGPGTMHTIERHVSLYPHVSPPFSSSNPLFSVTFFNPLSVLFSVSLLITLLSSLCLPSQIFLPLLSNLFLSSLDLLSSRCRSPQTHLC